MSNPFEVRTPETLTSQEIANLFVDVFTDFNKIKMVGHTFIHGFRGTGKSMMLRYLEPDVQIEAGNVTSLSELDFYAVHVPIKKAWSDITEWGFLTGASLYYISESILVIYILQKLVVSLKKNVKEKKILDSWLSLVKEDLNMFGISVEDFLEKKKFTLGTLERILKREFIEIKRYLKQLIQGGTKVNFQGALLNYLDFFVPVLENLKNVDLLPNKPFFILIDDADELNVGMQEILNSWVSSRTTDIVCLKISTQMRYKTYRTLDKKLIECPHDYDEVNINTIYTSSKKYKNRIFEIVEKRLNGISPEKYFLINKKQEEKIDNERTKLKENHKNGIGKGTNASDDVARYAIPNYMKNLALGKSSATYSYAGFDNLVAISSGVIRWFLDPASKMYAESLSETKKNVVNNISVSVQDSVIDRWSKDFLNEEFNKIILGSDDVKLKKKLEGLKNLINALGNTFRKKLLDYDLSERKVSSIIITGKLDSEIIEILDLGKDYGYLQKNIVGAKNGKGRTEKYTLSNRLAPYYKLDPTGYTYNMSVTNKALLTAIRTPDKFVEDKYGIDSSNNHIQGELELGL